MYIKWIHVKNYRNLRDVIIDFHHRINYFVGENAIGKSNFLDLLKILSSGWGFEEKDFFNPLEPIEIRIVFHGEVATFKGQDTSVEEQEFYLEQRVQELYPRLYAVTDKVCVALPLESLRLLVYLRHSGTDLDLDYLSREIYTQFDEELLSLINGESELGHLLPKGVQLLREGDGNVSKDFHRIVEHLALLLSAEGSQCRYTSDNIKLIMMVALKVLVQIYRIYKSLALNLQNAIQVDEKGRRLLPVFISIDEPEIHLNPYLQRSVLAYYRQIINNENKEFLRLLKDIFDLDGLNGQLFIVTHSTDALVDDYRHIIRFYRDGEGNVRSVSGVNFSFSKEVEKHLIMHFPEFKEALYARCVIIVEGETEYGSFRGFGKTVNIDFDYYGICLINARGEASISKLYSLFKRFAIPTLLLYDRDVMGKYGTSRPNYFYTDEICFEMDLVVHLLRKRKRRVLDRIVSELTDNGKGMVTKEMLRKGVDKMGVYRMTLSPRALKNISDRRIEDLVLYYFSWFYGNKGVVVGREIATALQKEEIPPAFLRVVEEAKEYSLCSNFSNVEDVLKVKE